MVTAGTGLVKTNSQPTVDPQYFVRELGKPVTLDGMPTNPDGYPMVSPAQAFDIGKEEGGDADLEDNKTATINVSTYTEPVEITPTEGKDGMKKATVTLSNIPTATVLSAWKLETAIAYTKTAEPTTSDKAIVPVSTGLSEAVIAAVAAEFASITIGESTYTRYSDGDIEF